MLLILSVLWVVFSKIETPTEIDTTTKRAGDASAAEQKSTHSDTPSVAAEQKSTQSVAQSARTDTEHPRQSTKNDVETKMCQVADRDFYHLTGIAVSRGQNSVPDSEQVPVDDTLTAEEVVAAGEKDPSVLFKIDVPVFGIRFNDGLDITWRPRQPVIDAQQLSQTERVRLCGLRRIERMGVLTLYNNYCADRPSDDNAAAAAIIESQFKKLPEDVQGKTLDYQVKAIEANPGGWTWFCNRVINDIKEGDADFMFKTARQGFFPIEGN